MNFNKHQLKKLKFEWNFLMAGHCLGAIEGKCSHTDAEVRRLWLRPSGIV
jgi:hypothetical protein